MASTIPKPIGLWTALKLEYLDHYLQAYRTATKGAHEAYYLDLFAGCEDCLLKATGWEVPGSPWRALDATPSFSRCLFVEKDKALARHLEARIAECDVKHAQVFRGDCNGPVLDELLSAVPRRALSFGFLDPSRLQLRWSTVERLAHHRLGPYKMELLILYPYDMVIKRWLSYSKLEAAFTAFFGDWSWKEAWQQSQARQEDDDTRRRRLVELYKRKLKELRYRFVTDYVPLGYKGQPYYHVIFAGDQPIGQKIMSDVWSKPKSVPGQLGYRPVRGAVSREPESVSPQLRLEGL